MPVRTLRLLKYSMEFVLQADPEGRAVMIKMLKPNENPFRAGSKLAEAWRIVRGYGNGSAVPDLGQGGSSECPQTQEGVRADREDSRLVPALP